MFISCCQADIKFLHDLQKSHGDQVILLTTLLLSQPQFKQTIPAGSPLSEAQVRKLVDESSIEKFCKGTEIYKKGKQDDFLSLVVDGELDIEDESGQKMAKNFQVMGLETGLRGFRYGYEFDRNSYFKPH